jgi:hypothetical protein
MNDMFATAKYFLDGLKDLIPTATLVAASAISGYQYIRWKLRK